MSESTEMLVYRTGDRYVPTRGKKTRTDCDKEENETREYQSE